MIKLFQLSNFIKCCCNFPLLSITLLRACYAVSAMKTMKRQCQRRRRLCFLPVAFGVLTVCFGQLSNDSYFIYIKYSWQSIYFGLIQLFGDRLVIKPVSKWH